MSDGLKTLHLVVKGAVQGVGYRASSKYQADKLNIKGCVKNLSDNTVEIYAQGTPKDLEEFVAFIKKPRGLARVEHISIDEYSTQKIYPNFEIIF